MKVKRIFFLLGATGNTVASKLYGAIAELHQKEIINTSDFKLIGVGGENLTSPEYKTYVAERMGISCKDIPYEIEYVCTDFHCDDFDLLEKQIETDAELYFYLSVHPEYYLNILEKINCCKHIDNHNVRIILEKPYGKDYEHTVKVNKSLSEYFKEEQIFRMEYCLGNTGVDELLHFKKTESLRKRWNKKYIEEFNFIFIEKGSIEELIQSHILQLMVLCITDEGDFEDRSENMNAIAAILDSFNGCSNSFKFVQIEELKNSLLVKGKISIDSGRWRGVNFNIFAGKGMDNKINEVQIKFKDMQKPIFFDFMENNHYELSECALLIRECIAGRNQRFLTAEEAELSWKFGSDIKRLIDKENIIE